LEGSSGLWRQIQTPGKEEGGTNMKSLLIRTAAVTSLVTALVVSGVSYYVMPKLQANNQEQYLTDPVNGGVTLQPAMYRSSAQPVVYTQPRVRRVAMTQPANTAVQRDAYGEPIVQKKRSTTKSVMIVAGSAGAGAAIGAMAGGKKGAGIGAISGGVAGLIYDRMTANKQ
jgi:hypothetical protein